MKFGCEDLDVYKIAREYVTKIYRITKVFPSTEQYGVTSQINRAAVSIVLNIAEGSAKESKKEFKKYLRNAIASLIETDTALKVSIDLGYVYQKDYDALSPVIKELYFKMIGLTKYLSRQQ